MTTIKDKLLHSETGKAMFDWISNIYDNSKVMVELYEALGQEFDDINLLVDDISKQMFIQTATWGLRLWEARFNLPINENDSYIERRNKALAKLQTRVTINPLTMATIIKNICGIDTIINEWVDEYVFEVRFVSLIGVPKEIEQIQHALDRVKPAHMKYRLIFNYRTWNEIKNYGKPWGYWKMLGLTWKELKESQDLEANKYNINLLNRTGERKNSTINDDGTIVESNTSNTSTSKYGIYLSEGDSVEFTKTDSSTDFKYAIYRKNNTVISVSSIQSNKSVLIAPPEAFKMIVSYPTDSENIIKFKRG